MEANTYNKKKIFNDPIYGFITVPNDLIFDLIEHPYFQRLRRIKQLGLTHLVYPGALHTRFHHAMGAMHLMSRAIEVLRSKGQKITEKEALGAQIAILLHDIGHGPFSHSLEYSIVKNVTHEDISAFFMDKLNLEFNGQLSTALKIFRNEYPKKFLFQLVSSQLDVDRLDYLKRDSFYTGVSEGVISTDRIISMLNVKNDELCIEAKGIYSVEKFIIARRLMYWQVYLHKTVQSAEKVIANILKRAKELAHQGEELFCTPALHFFLYNDFGKSDFVSNPEVLEKFALLDDFDITTSVKVWADHSDKVLSILCKGIINRKLYKIELRNSPLDQKEIEEKKKEVHDYYPFNENEMSYLVFSGDIANNAYSPKKDKIHLLYKDGNTKDIADAADQLNITMLSKPVRKYYFCYPKKPLPENLGNFSIDQA